MFSKLNTLVTSNTFKIIKLNVCFSFLYHFIITHYYLTKGYVFNLFEVSIKKNSLTEYIQYNIIYRLKVNKL